VHLFCAVAMSRRIDALYCSRATANQQIGSVIKEISQKATEARHEVTNAIKERIEALQERERMLIVDIEELRNSKVRVLEKQMLAIESGTCPLAESDDPDAANTKDPLNPTAYLLDTDAVISFRLGECDFMKTIPTFGAIDDQSTYASKTYAKGPALGIMKMHNQSALWVFACNRTGERRIGGGDRVTCSVCSPQDFDPIEVEDLKDGRYRLKFVPRNPGSYTLNLKVGPEGQEEPVRGSPFELVVRAPTNYGLLGGLAGSEEPEGKTRIGLAGEKHKADEIGTVHHPCGIDFDHTGRFLLVADQSNHRIQAFDTHDNHKVVCMFGKRGFGVQDMDTPHAVCTDRDNRVVVSDVLNHRLQVMQFCPRTKTLKHIRSVGCSGSGPGEFQFPKGLCVTENGQLMVCDFGNHRVQVFDMAGGFKFVREWGVKGADEGQFNSPLDIATNREGEILVSDMNNRIQIFDNNAKFLRMFGKFGRKDGDFNYPISLVTNDENALFVCDQGNHRMQVFEASDGTFIHKWGGSRNKKIADPPPEEEEGGEKPPEWIGLRNPAGVAVNADGTVVVTDYKLNSIFAF